MRALRLALACLAALLVAAPAAPARAAGNGGPTGLHGFLLRADEPRRDTFARTPSFAWNPVAGARRYEFQLSTSSLFRDSGIVYSDEALTSPAAAVPISLPWITGSPYSLYARVRAVRAKAVTPWSRPYGFTMRWPSLPVPLESFPGLLRWTPVEGATGYTVWYLFPDGTSKQFTVYTNVADEREWYTFHQSATYAGQVKWRVRAVRRLYGERANGLPAVSYGPWSPVYTTQNPAFASGPMALGGTVSDAVSGPRATAAHQLMPAFLFSGNRSVYGQTAELYRVYVFTDRDCVNAVFRGAVVGGPAYAPRPFGPLALPTTDSTIAAARRTFLRDGKEPVTTTYDLERVETTEQQASAAPYSPNAKSADPTTGTTPAGTFTTPQNVGAPVDLWDTDWPRGRYWWTAVPVVPVSPDALSLTLSGGAAVGATAVAVSGSGLAAGDQVTIGVSPSQDRATVVAVSGSTIQLSAPLAFAHGPGEAVVRAGASVEYRDLELAQEACAAGRVLSFGKTSEPVVTAASAPYASGLSPKGRLVSAVSRSSSFYGAPLVAWAPALGASAYEVQWSRTRYPFRAAAAPVVTASTAVTLPLRPGTWYYRVRGINYSAPTGAQPMSWSDPVRIRIARPTFRVVGER
ncbi:MAG TPA: hypothetical protein VLB86_00320 [Gaiellaceae bacterium]|nr:hypothetical protein [Gaiellaceae bacterium]